MAVEERVTLNWGGRQELCAYIAVGGGVRGGCKGFIFLDI
jgi:hypothetical protein